MNAIIDGGERNRLVEFLCDDEGLSTDAVCKELETEGVNAVSFLAKMKDTVRKGIQAAWRKQAEKERSDDEMKADGVRKEVLSLSSEQLMKIIFDAQMGKLGHTGQELAMAARNKESIEPTMEEIRTWVEDILLASGKLPEEGEKK